ncbi:MAG: hypothetical protein FJ034_09005 [Chloroflexi bacterium]|nr:hypothetical protein [Chloroflexota bacterium]
MDDRRIDRVLAAAPVAPLPPGFRDGVLRRVAPHRSTAWEWAVAALLAIPSLAYLAFTAGAYGGDFTATAEALALAAQSTETAAGGLFVDGLVVLAVAMCGLASILAAHALGTRSNGGRSLSR